MSFHAVSHCVTALFYLLISFFVILLIKGDGARAERNCPSLIKTQEVASEQGQGAAVLMKRRNHAQHMQLVPIVSGLNRRLDAIFWSQPSLLSHPTQIRS